MTALEAGEQPGAGVRMLAELESAGLLDATSLRITDPDFPFEQWASLGAYLVALRSTSCWLIGDWFNFGEGAYGERLWQAVSVTGLSEQTIKNYSWVCSHVARSRRRDPRVLSFAVHAEVAAQEPREQTEWLDRAEREGWTSRDVREQLKLERPREPVEQPSWTVEGGPITEGGGVDEAAERAEKLLARPLPEGHPLWRRLAEGGARDVLALAPAARAALERPPAVEAGVLRPPYRFEVAEHGPATIYDSVDVGWVCRVKETLPHKGELARLIAEALNEAARAAEGRP